jgi:hypothetical protein
MGASWFRNTLASLALLWAAQPAAAQPARPVIQSLSLTLQDGRSYSLTSKELEDAKGGALFWGDWAVTQILAPHYSLRPDRSVSAASVLKLWFTPGPSGEFPAFLIHTSDGPVYPLESTAGLPGHRAKVVQILVGYSDGRVLPLSDLTLRDRRSGVIFWNDFAVTDLLRPFYVSAKGLPTRPEDVTRIWNQPTPAPFTQSIASAMERPGFLVKPACIPTYPGPD